MQGENIPKFLRSLSVNKKLYKPISLKTLLIISILLAVFVRCRNNPTKLIEPINDTAEVIKFAIKTAFQRGNLSEIPALYHGHLFNDSILLETDSIPDRLFPIHVDSMIFKKANGLQIAQLMHSYNIDSLPNCLFICCFEKTDSFYHLHILNRSYAPFGAGGSMDVKIGKRQDSMFVIEKSFNSIN
jgi:hypothetical protein